jgi:hypothetical protein
MRKLCHCERSAAIANFARPSFYVRLLCSSQRQDGETWVFMGIFKKGIFLIPASWLLLLLSPTKIRNQIKQTGIRILTLKNTIP